MALTITSLADHVPTVHTYSEISKSQTQAEWLDVTTGQDAGERSNLTVRQNVSRPAGRVGARSPTRRTSVTLKKGVTYPLAYNPSGANATEEVSVVLTIIKPELLAVVGADDILILITQLKNLLSTGVIAQLVRGEV